MNTASVRPQLPVGARSTGPELRERAGAQARRMAAHAWAPWLYRCLPVTFLVNGRWDSPAVAVPAAIVVVGLPLAYSRWLALFQRDGERWPADPPGPPRTTAPPSTVERWSSGRSAVLVAVGLLVAIVVGTGAALLID